MKNSEKQKFKPQKGEKNKKSFEERFKDKKSSVGRAGLLDVLNLHQPFDLEARMEDAKILSPKNP